jgi:hypothetical protein
MATHCVTVMGHGHALAHHAVSLAASTQLAILQHPQMLATMACGPAN